MKEISLTTKEELDIYMSPTRQKLLRLLSLAGSPMTPKQLSDRLEISASGVQHHIKKLMQLGVVELDHTETINGINASFYKHAQVMIHIGLSRSDELAEQKEVLVQNSIAQVYDGFRSQMKKRVSMTGERDSDKLQKWGDILSGVVYLEEKESSELMKLITGFIEQHSAPAPGSSSWEYAIIAYNAGEPGNE
ncbi:MAG TPA: helix-turn-helix domain-containing protein [Clostridia bacterium]|nr:helix-turn-helix domain-containing protein [Clostridia bacterium]